MTARWGVARWAVQNGRRRSADKSLPPSSFWPWISPFSFLQKKKKNQTCRPVYTGFLSVILTQCVSLEKQREERRAFVGAQCSRVFMHRGEGGGPEIDMMWSPGTWIVAVKVHADSISHREMTRYRPVQSAHLQNPFKQPECIFHAGSSDVVELYFFKKGCICITAPDLKGLHLLVR